MRRGYWALFMAVAWSAFVFCAIGAGIQLERGHGNLAALQIVLMVINASVGFYWSKVNV